MLLPDRFNKAESHPIKPLLKNPQIISNNPLICYLPTGLAWPVEGAHYLLKSVSWMFPLTLTTQGLRGMTARGWPLMHPTVLEGVASIVVWIGLFVLICIVLIKTEKGSWVSAK